MTNIRRMYGRTFIPTYALRRGRLDLDYAPWMIGHEDYKKLNDEILIPIWEEVYAQDDDDALEVFCDTLAERGYQIFPVVQEMLILEV